MTNRQKHAYHEQFKTIYTGDNFLTLAVKTLREIGFIANKHQFTPYGSCIYDYVEEIAPLLAKSGFVGEVKAGKAKSPELWTTAYYIYSISRFTSPQAAASTVKAFLRKRLEEDNLSISSITYDDE